MARISGWTTADGLWLVSDFREAGTRVGRVWTRGVIRGLYAAFRVLTGLRVTRVPDYAAAFVACGYQLRCEEQRLGGLVFSGVWQRSDGGKRGAVDMGVLAICSAELRGASQGVLERAAE